MNTSAVTHRTAFACIAIAVFANPLTASYNELCHPENFHNIKDAMEFVSAQRVAGEPIVLSQTDIAVYMFYRRSFNMQWMTILEKNLDLRPRRRQRTLEGVVNDIANRKGAKFWLLAAHNVPDAQAFIDLLQTRGMVVEKQHVGPSSIAALIASPIGN